MAKVVFLKAVTSQFFVSCNKGCSYCEQQHATNSFTGAVFGREQGTDISYFYSSSMLSFSATLHSQSANALMGQ